jgi:hypothetical protein
MQIAATCSSNTGSGQMRQKTVTLAAAAERRRQRWHGCSIMNIMSGRRRRQSAHGRGQDRMDGSAAGATSGYVTKDVISTPSYTGYVIRYMMRSMMYCNILYTVTWSRGHLSLIQIPSGHCKGRATQAGTPCHLCHDKGCAAHAGMRQRHVGLCNHGRASPATRPHGTRSPCHTAVAWIRVACGAREPSVGAPRAARPMEIETLSPSSGLHQPCRNYISCRGCGAREPSVGAPREARRRRAAAARRRARLDLVGGLGPVVGGVRLPVDQVRAVLVHL